MCIIMEVGLVENNLSNPLWAFFLWLVLLWGWSFLISKIRLLKCSPIHPHHSEDFIFKV